MVTKMNEVDVCERERPHVKCSKCIRIVKNEEKMESRRNGMYKSEVYGE